MGKTAYKNLEIKKLISWLE